MLRYVPLPKSRIVFRAAPFLMVGLGCFGLDRLTGQSFFFYTGLMLTYMGVGKLISNMIAQVSDHAYHWFISSPRTLPVVEKLTVLRKALQ